jgi:hypothetical protein
MQTYRLSSKAVGIGDVRQMAEPDQDLHAWEADAPISWLFEFRPTPTILFCEDLRKSLLAPLVANHSQPTFLQLQAELGDGSVGTDQFGLLPDIEQEFISYFRDVNRDRIFDVVVLSAGLLSYEVLSEVRLNLNRLGVIIIHIPEVDDLRSQHLALLKKFVADKKIDDVKLSETYYCIFVWSWNVSVAFPATPVLSQPLKRSLALAVIARNEAHSIGNMLRSASPIVSFAAILDTGSTDNTIDVVRETLIDEGIEFIVESTEFSNFSEARNQCILMVPASIEWILMLDADEIIKPDDFERFYKILEDDEHDAWALPRLNWETAAFERSMSYPDRQLRLFRNGRNMRYEGVVHERLVGYRSLGWPPLNLSFIGQVGGPHIHHLTTVYLTRDQHEMKRKWYEELAKKSCPR